MNITQENKKAMNELLLETLPITWEDLWAIENEDCWWELDEDDFHYELGQETPYTPENIIKYYKKCPEDLETIYDEIRAESDFRNWNVNAWRNK